MLPAIPFFHSRYNRIIPGSSFFLRPRISERYCHKAQKHTCDSCSSIKVFHHFIVDEEGIKRENIKLQLISHRKDWRCINYLSVCSHVCRFVQNMFRNIVLVITYVGDKSKEGLFYMLFCINEYVFNQFLPEPYPNDPIKRGCLAFETTSCTKLPL